MARYTTAEALDEAVSRLAGSSARASLCEFLILKHAMRHGDGTVTLSLADDTYINSVLALAAITTGPNEEGLPPFFNPFGTKREARKGWRTEKYPSNGPPDTVNGPGWKRVIDVLSERPRRVRFTADYLNALPSVISLAGGKRPLLEDCAVWYFRNRDLESIAGEADPTIDLLVEEFVAETGLSSAELALIFAVS